MAKTYEILTRDATDIEKETRPNSNTALRIGTLFIDIINKICEYECFILSVSPESIILPQAGATKEVTVTSIVNWTVEGDHGIVTAEPPTDAPTAET